MTLSDIMRWLPDELDHCSAMASMTAAEVSSRFGVSALLISCWACLTHSCSEEELKRLLAASDTNLWEVVEQWEKEVEDAMPGSDAEANLFAPGPKILAEMLLQST